MNAPDRGNTRSARTAAAAGILLMAGVAAAPARCAEIELAAGEGDRIRMAGARAAATTGTLACRQACEATVRASAGLARWWSPYDTGESSDLWDWSALAGLRIGGRAPAGLVVEVGAGFHYLTRLSLVPDRAFGAHWQFGEYLSVSLPALSPDGFTWAVRVEHVSNGGFAAPNTGVTFFGLELRIALRHDS